MFGWFSPNRGTGETKNALSADEIRREEEQYGNEVIRAFRRSVGGGGAALIGLSIIAVATVSARDGASPLVAAPQLDRSGAGAALAVLLPLAIALQVLNRMPRDPEAPSMASPTAQRQFWGGIASVVAVASAFVGWIALVSEIVTVATRGTAIDVVSVLGIPLGAFVAALVASDAAAISTMQSRHLGLDAARRRFSLVELRTARARIPGLDRPRAARSFVIQAVVSGTVATGALAAIVHVTVHDGRTTLLYGVAALIIVVFGTAMLPSIARSAYQLQLSTLLSNAVLFALVAAVYSLQTTAAVLTLNPSVEAPGDVAPMIIVGLLVPLPAVLVSLVLALPGSDNRRRTPLSALAHRSLERSISKLQSEPQPSRRSAPWERYALTATALSVVPVAAAFPAVIAWKVRRAQQDVRKPGLAIASWVLPSTFLVLETAAFIALPWVAVAWGWVRLS